MKLKLFALFGLLVLVAPLSAEAAVDRAVIIDQYTNIDELDFGITYLDGDTAVAWGNASTTWSSVNSGKTVMDGEIASALLDAADRGYSLTAGQIFFVAPKMQDVEALIASSTKALSFATTTRSLNSNYTISTTRAADVVYSINASWTVNALLSGTGTAYLEYSTDSGSTWNTVSQVSKTLNLLTVAGGDEMNLSGKIPANALTRIRTSSTNMTISFVRSQEVLLPSN